MTALRANRDAALALLGDPVPRALYQRATEGPLTRDAAAEAVGIPRSTVAVHLDRLAEAGLLVTDYERLSGRTGHFMPASLLQSQVDTLEPLDAGEHGIQLDLRQTPDELIAAAVDWIETAF